MVLGTPVLIKQAVHQNRISSLKGIQERLFSFFFDGFVYNQIWEDPRVDLEAMQVDSESRILTISSGGCNLLNYLIAKPHSVHAVDLNRYHLYFTGLKLNALKHLPGYKDFFNFFGCADKKENVDNYHQYIKPNLDENARNYWENGMLFQKPRINYFSKNVYNYGTMGFFIRLVHFLARRFAQSPEKLVELNDTKEREAYFDHHFAPFFNNALVRWLGKLPLMFYCLGIPPQQFQAMKKESNGRLNELYCERVKRLACQFPIEDNYFAWQAFKRAYDQENRNAIPDYLKQDHYDYLKENLHKIRLYYTSFTDLLKTHPNNSFNRYVLLDSQDWMSNEMIAELWSEIARTGMPASRIIFRTASDVSPIEDALPAELRQRFEYEKERSHELFMQDRSAIYGGFHIYALKE